MANNYTPDEIQDIFDEYHRNLAAGIPVSKDLAERLKDATTGVKNYTFAMNQSLRSLGSSVKTLGFDLSKGANGAAVFNNSIEAGADVVDKFASKFGILGTVIGGVIKAGGMYVSAVNKQSDALYKSFQDISKTGSLGAGGMSEVFSSMQKFGYAVDELGQMQSLLAQNSTALAKFGGTAYDGARSLADVSNELQRGKLGERFRNMGLSVDDINQNAAGYIKTQVSLGRSRIDVEKNLTAETSKYIEQVVAVQKLTGQTREQLEEKQAQASREEAFAYQQYELKKKAAAGDAQAQKEYERNLALSRILDGKAREQFIAGVGGDVAAMGDLMRTAPETVEKILNGGDLPSVLQSLAKEGQTAVDNLGPLAKFHGFNNFLLPIDQLLEITSQYGGKNMNEVLKAIDRNKETTDDATKSQTSLQMSQMNTRQAMENLVNAGIGPVTSAMQTLAEIIESIVGMLPNFKQKGYGAGGTGSKGGSLASTGAGALSGAAIGTAFGGPVGTVIGAGVGAAAGFFGYELGGGSSAGGKPETVLDFGGQSGSRDNFLKLDRDMQGRIVTAGENYMKVTGNKLKINSAFRDREDQERLYNETVAAGRPGVGPNGMPVAKPGTSSHESGYAVDIEQGKSDREAINALNNQGLFQTVANDPVHFAYKKISGAFGWNGTVSGPMSGYSPNLLMHGTEQLSIRPAASMSSDDSVGGSSSSNVELISKIDDLIYIAKSQLQVNEKILKYQH